MGPPCPSPFQVARFSKYLSTTPGPRGGEATQNRTDLRKGPARRQRSRQVHRKHVQQCEASHLNFWRGRRQEPHRMLHNASVWCQDMVRRAPLPSHALQGPGHHKFGQRFVHAGAAFDKPFSLLCVCVLLFSGWGGSAMRRCGSQMDSPLVCGAA